MSSVGDCMEFRKGQNKFRRLTGLLHSIANAPHYTSYIDYALYSNLFFVTFSRSSCQLLTRIPLAQPFLQCSSGRWQGISDSHHHWSQPDELNFKEYHRANFERGSAVIDSGDLHPTGVRQLQEFSDLLSKNLGKGAGEILRKTNYHRPSAEDLLDFGRGVF